MSARSASTAWDIACDAADPPTPAPLPAPLDFPAPATRHDCPSESSPPPPTAPPPTRGPDGPAAPALEGRGGAVPPPFRLTGSSGGRRTLSGPVGSVSGATSRAGRFSSGGSSSSGGGGAEDGCGRCSVGGSFLRRAEVIWAGSGVRRVAVRVAAAAACRAERSAHGLRACAHCLHAASAHGTRQHTPVRLSCTTRKVPLATAAAVAHIVPLGSRRRRFCRAGRTRRGGRPDSPGSGPCGASSWRRCDCWRGCGIPA